MNPILSDLEESIKQWKGLWNKSKDWHDDPQIIAYGCLPYTNPFGITWNDESEPYDDGDVGEIESKHYETQKTLLEGLSHAVRSGYVFDSDYMMLLVDMEQDSDLAGVIFSDDKHFFGTALSRLQKYDEAPKSIWNSRVFYNNLKMAQFEGTYPKEDYKERYSHWEGWLDNSGDFYGNLSDVIRDLKVFQFDNENEDMLNFEDNVEDDFTKYWVIVRKPEGFMLPMIMNWNKESAEQLWNLLNR